MFAYFVHGLFALARELTSAEWANLSINKPEHAILRSVRRIRLGGGNYYYKDMYKRSKTGTLNPSDYLKVYHLLKRDFMGKMSTESLPL